MIMKNKPKQHDKVILVGSINAAKKYRIEDIDQALQETPTLMEHGSEFTGRPGTIILEKNNSVFKLKYDISLNEKNAFNWVEKNLEKEKEWGIYHPDKTWFIIKTGDEFTPGNVTPLLTPLHIALGVADATDDRVIKNKIKREKLLCELFNFYLSFSKETDEKQDEGLSNYGIDDTGNLFYLDDDIYTWDEFSAFSQMLGVFLRSIPWVNKEVAKRLGISLRQTILDLYNNDFHSLRVIHELLKGLYVSDDLKPALNTFANELINVKKIKRGKKGKKLPVKKVVGKRFAVLADVHANYPAIEAIFKDMKSVGIDQGYILGDIVGYGPHPRECIDFVEQSNLVVIQGNHDHALGNKRWEERFSRHAKMSAEWTSLKLKDSDREWLCNLPPFVKNKDYWCIHGAPVDPTFFNAYVYHMTYERNLDFMQEHNIPLCFHGHTHMPKVYIRSKGNVDDILEQESMSLKQVPYKLICPGSIGQPRNGNPKAQYVIWDGESGELTYRSVEYDTQIVLDDMEKDDFPLILKEYQTRLFTGVYSG